MQQAPCKTKQNFSPYKKETTHYIDPFKVAFRILMFDAIILALTNTEYGKVAPTTEVYRQADN